MTERQWRRVSIGVWLCMALLGLAGWKWNEQRNWIRQYEACTKLGVLCSAECAE
jgi:hypothetical protein